MTTKQKIEIEGDKLFRILLKGFAEAQGLKYQNVVCDMEAFEQFQDQLYNLIQEERKKHNHWRYWFNKGARLDRK